MTTERCPGGNSPWWDCVYPKGHKGDCNGHDLHSSPAPPAQETPSQFDETRCHHECGIEGDHQDCECVKCGFTYVNKEYRPTPSAEPMSAEQRCPNCGERNFLHREWCEFGRGCDNLLHNDILKELMNARTELYRNLDSNAHDNRSEKETHFHSETLQDGQDVRQLALRCACHHKNKESCNCIPIDQDKLRRELTAYAAHVTAALREEKEKWKHRAHLFREAYEEESTKSLALTIQKLDLESLGNEAMRIQRDRARGEAKGLVSKFRERAEKAEQRVKELEQDLMRLLRSPEK